MKLGKQPHKFDERTARLGEFIEIPKVPNLYDFDHNRTPLPVEAWGNYDWGDCVEVGKYLGMVRLERVETRRTVKVTTEDVLNHYKAECAAAWGLAPTNPGDQYDNGLIVLDSMRDWRGNGLSVAAQKYRISAYGELTPNDHTEIRAACYLLRGVYFGINLPRTAHTQIISNQPWDVTSDIGSEPGSWGGHLVYAKRYDSGGFYCITWGQEQYMTNAFIDKYCDEAWGVVDDFNTAKRNKSLDVFKLLGYLRQIGASNLG